MYQVTIAIGFALVVAVRSTLALADPASSSASAASAFASRSAAPSIPAPPVAGLAVVAVAESADAAWPLARAIYAETSLRPRSLDEQHARALCGEAPPDAAPPDVRDLVETVGALRGDDAPSRALLADIARRFSVRAVMVVRLEAGHPIARAFLPDAGAFDAATYAPDDATMTSWSSATRSLVRAFGDDAAHAPALATHEEQHAQPRHREFYESGWFWGALGAAAFASGAVFLATRDSGTSAIHLHLEVPP